MVHEPNAVQESAPTRTPITVDPARPFPRGGQVAGGLLGRLGRQRMSAMTVAATAVIVVIAFVAIFADQVAPYDPLAGNYSAIRKPPSAAHLLGTDDVGRDVLSRLIYGARVSLAVGFGSVLIGDMIGLIWGIASGYLGRRFDLLSQRLLEVVLAFPGLILAT